MSRLNNNLLVQFSLLSFGVMLVISVSLAFIMSDGVRTEAIDDLVSEAVGTASPRILTRITPADLQTPMTGARYDDFHAFVQASIASERTARVKLWSPDGTIIYGNNPDSVGQQYSDNENLLEALEGKNSTEIKFPTDPENELERHLGTLLTVYTPLYFEGSEEPAGVLEIYQYFAPTAARIETLQRRVFLGIGVGFLALYSILVTIVWNGWRTIQQQQADLASSNEDLLASNAERDELLVSERTQRRQAESMGRVGLALNATLDLPDLLDLICRESITLFQVQAAFLWLIHEENLVGFAGYGQGRGQFIGMQRPLSDPQALSARVIRESQPIFVNDARSSPQVCKELSDLFGVESIMGVPLLNGHRAVGALMFIDKENPVRFRDEDLNPAKVLATHAALAIESAKLFENLQRSNVELSQAYDTTLEGWSHALELRDHNTLGHTRRVTDLTLRLARKLGIIGEELIQIRRGAILHDIGKMGIPDSILLKPGPLSQEEWAVMHQHPQHAYEMLYPIEFLRPALEIPHCHHEKWDGSGYPQGLKGTEIPLSARIFAVVDVWDALLSDRPYRAAWPREAVRAHLQKEAGKHFDPQIIDAFLELEASIEMEAPLPTYAGF